MSKRKAFDIPAINNQLEVLAIHLRINTDVDSELARIEVLDTTKGLHLFKFENRIYQSAHSGKFSGRVIEFNSNLWVIRDIEF